MYGRFVHASLPRLSVPTFHIGNVEKKKPLCAKHVKRCRLLFAEIIVGLMNYLKRAYTVRETENTFNYFQSRIYDSKCRGTLPCAYENE